jgi:excisionase family DNA binding protein
MSVFMLWTVAQVAKLLQCSDRRVRALLAQGRLSGYREGNHHWKVFWPLNIRPGRRGPDLRHMPTRHVLKPGKALSPLRQGSGLPEGQKSEPRPSGQMTAQAARCGAGSERSSVDPD